MDFWATLWTVVWFGGLAVFCVLSILVIIFGASDLLSLLRTLKARHTSNNPAPDESE